MRKTFLSVLLVLGLLPLQAEEYEYLWLYSPMESGTRSYSIEDLWKITFSEEAMNVYFDNQSEPITWPYANLLKMSFEAEPVTAVESLSESSDISIRHSLFEIRVESLSSLKSVAVYNLQGLRFAEFGQGETTVSYPMNALPSGVYVVRAENAEHIKTLKFIKH